MGRRRGSASGSVGASLLPALAVLLSLCPVASAAPLSTADAQATIQLAPALRRSMHRGGVKVMVIAPATLAGATVTLPGNGSVDPITGRVVIGCEGGLAFRRGRRVVRMDELRLDTAGGSLEANLGPGEMGVATTSFVAGPEGFGTRAESDALHLTGAVAHLLRARLHLPPTHRRPRAAGHRRRHRAVRRRSERVFTRGRSLGTVSLDAQPGAVAVEPGGGLTLVLDPVIAAKLRDVGVRISGGIPVAGSEPDSFLFGVTGGSFDLAGQALHLVGGDVLRFDQTLETVGVVVGQSEVDLTDPSLELPSATFVADLTGNSDAVPYLGFGDLGQTAVGDLLAPLGPLSVDPAARTVGLQATRVILTPVVAQSLDGFRRLYENRKREEKPGDQIDAGEPLGTVSFSAQVE